MPERRSAFAARSAHAGQPPAGGIVLRVRANPVLYNLRGDRRDGDFLAAARMALGCALPLAANATALSPFCSVLWLGPDAWLIDGHDGKMPAPPVIAGGFLTDVSHGYAVLRVAGDSTHTRQLLAKGCSLDFHERHFAPGQCAQSLLARWTVTLHLIDAAGSFDVYCARSYAAGVQAWLEDAAAEFGCRTGPPL